MDSIVKYIEQKGNNQNSTSVGTNSLKQGNTGFDVSGVSYIVLALRLVVKVLMKLDNLYYQIVELFESNLIMLLSGIIIL